MYALPRSNYVRRSFTANKQRPAASMKLWPINHNERVRQELESLGVTKYGLRKLESRYLPHIIHANEHLGGVVYGRQKGDSVMLVATDRRIIFLDKKPLFVNEDEITYDVVSGVKYSSAGLGTTVILHTRVKDFVIHTFNQHCALGFVEYIESRCLEHGNISPDKETNW